MKISELLHEPDLLEGFEDEVIVEQLLALIEEDGGFDTSGPPEVPNLGQQPTPPSGYGGGWVRGGPFRPFSGGGKWFGELYGSVKQLAVASRMKKRLKDLGIKGVGVDRVSSAYNSALFNVRDLLKNPQKTAYHFPMWTTKTAKKPKIPIWREAQELASIILETNLERKFAFNQILDTMTDMLRDLEDDSEIHFEFPMSKLDYKTFTADGSLNVRLPGSALSRMTDDEDVKARLAKKTKVGTDKYTAEGVKQVERIIAALKAEESEGFVVEVGKINVPGGTHIVISHKE